MTATTINSIGLIFDLVGALLLFRFGLPNPISKGGVQYLILEQSDDKEAKKARIHEAISYFAVALLAFGFALQLWSNYH